ncbi:hypothetical protein ERO13_D12G251000v2 [Gossypium hirsutum]|uniref:GDSL esterase/lipase At4g10955 n=1 Tax=Gossypium hirsutum TaxID=3635 RepID=A0A1U8NH87_GOSHI|nr:GDSL esterase/lipase At4g10955 [Gossypium hirsutum]KAG4117757.1 hypothetical protein ERO13_D12G251000v2 [Gossypium hirsutum]
MEGKAASERQIFNLSGPLHLTSIDWNNFHHRRSVAASLVQGVYIQERDRQENRRGAQAHASPWWDFFNFQLIRPLVDDVDNSIFGAIYENKSFTSNSSHSAQNAPRYVIAIRGTISKPATISLDLKLDLMCVRNKLHESYRFQLAMQAVQSIIGVAGTSHIWLAGHSLGSAISLLIGKNVIKTGYSIEAYFFNPPFSTPIEIIKNEKLKRGIRITSSLVKAGVAVATKGRHQKPQQEDPYILLSKWIPFLFVNPADKICSGYIAYFEHRKKLKEIGAGKIERIATWNSIGSSLSTSAENNPEPLHLLPSAYLTVNLSKSPDFKRAHGIHQWWDSNFYGQSELHEYSYCKFFPDIA